MPTATSSAIKQHAVAPGQLPHAPQEARRVDDHPRRRLHQGLDHQGRDPRVLGGQDPLQLAEIIVQRGGAGHAGRRAVRIGGRHAERLEQQRLEHGVEPLDPAHAHAPQRVAVIGVAEGDVPGLLRLGLGALAPILERHLQGHFDRRGTVVGEEDVLQARRGKVHQPLGQPDRRGVRRAEVRHVRHAVQLPADRLVELRVAVAVDVAPQAADAVQIAVPVDVEQRTPFGPLDHQRLVFGHLGEGVPDDPAVPVSELVGSRVGHGGRGFRVQGSGESA